MFFERQAKGQKTISLKGYCVKESNIFVRTKKRFFERKWGKTIRSTNITNVLHFSQKGIFRSFQAKSDKIKDVKAETWNISLMESFQYHDHPII
jgi:hypothetical protein